MTRIGIFGFYGVGNLGNVAIQEAMIKNIHRYFPAAEICGFSLNPQDTERCHHIRAFPIKRGRGPTNQPPPLDIQSARQATPPQRQSLKAWLRKSPILWALVTALKGPRDRVEGLWLEWRFCLASYRLLRQFDMLIISGGGPLDDLWGGPWSHPYAVFKWALLTKLARKRLLVMSVGAESITSAWSRFFIRRALAWADYRSFRDAQTLARIRELGVTKETHLFPDIAFSLPLPASPRPARSSPRISVGISPIAYLDPRSWPRPNEERYRRYVETLATFASGLADRGHAVCFFSTVGRMDSLVIDDIRRSLSRDGRTYGDEQVVVKDIRELKDLLTHLAGLDFVVASRLHGVILSNLMTTPVLAVSYEAKVDQVMETLGLAEYCLSIDQITPDALASGFARLEANGDGLRRQIAARTAEFRDRLSKQYENVFAGLNDR